MKDSCGGWEEQRRPKRLPKNGTDGGDGELRWAYQAPFPKVHRTDGKIVEKEELQEVLLCYAHADNSDAKAPETVEMWGRAARLAEKFDMAEFAVYVNELFDRWLLEDMKKRGYWVLYVAAAYGGGAFVEKLEEKITEWQQREWDEPTCEALVALGQSPLPQAILVVDRVSRRFRPARVRRTANAVLAALAAQKNLTPGELVDFAIPDYGFDETMEQYIDYGERSFRVRLAPDFEFEAFKKNGKKFIRFPKPGKKDDVARAEAVYEAYKELKKQVRTTSGSQKQRMEQMLLVPREWEALPWVQLFTKNALLCQFAITLVWGVYEDGRLAQAFRYLGNGVFCTQDGGEYQIPDGAKIRLVHPVELSMESRDAWAAQFAHAGIEQLFEQMERSVYTLEEAEAGERAVLRFEGRKVEGKFFDCKLQDLDWYRGSVENQNYFSSYYRRDEQAGFEVWLHFSGSGVDELGDQEVTVYDIRFYRAGEDGQKEETRKRKDWMRVEPELNEACFLRDIPARYFSEIVWQVAKAGAFVMPLQ